MIKTLTQIRDNAFIKNVLLVLGASLLLGLSGPLNIPLPFTPIPLALRQILVPLLGIFLGPRRAALAVVAFIFQGVIGLPVFMGAGLFGPMAGYLVGYVAAAYITGKIAEKSHTYKNHFYALSMGSLSIYLFGMVGLTPYVGSIQKAFLLGVAPFVLGDLLKIILATKVSQSRANIFSNF
ncbi:MAG: biotin transporter BioY [Chlamydiales bacterium]